MTRARPSLPAARERSLASDGRGRRTPVLAQGVTTAMLNPDGVGELDLAARRDAILRDGTRVIRRAAIAPGRGTSMAAGMDREREGRPPARRRPRPGIIPALVFAETAIAAPP
jgi:hypothetical protein